MVCVDYSGDDVKVYGLIAVKEEDLSVLAGFLPMFPHYSEVRGRFAKAKILKAFPKRYGKVEAYIEKLVVSKDLRVIVEELEKLKGRVRVVYADIHVYRRVRGSLRGVKVLSENKKLLRRREPGVLTAFNILDLAINQYKRKR